MQHPCCLGWACCENAAGDGAGLLPTFGCGRRVCTRLADRRMRARGCVCEPRGWLGLAHQWALIHRAWELGRLRASESEDVGLFLRAHAGESSPVGSGPSHSDSAAHRWASVGGFSASVIGLASQCAALAALSSARVTGRSTSARGWGVCMFGVPLFEHRECNLCGVEKL